MAAVYQRNEMQCRRRRQTLRQKVEKIRRRVCPGRNWTRGSFAYAKGLAMGASRDRAEGTLGAETRKGGGRTEKLGW